MDERYNKQKYLIRKKIFKLVGVAFHIYDMQGELSFYVKQKGFKLKEDIKVYTDESMTTELLSIGARKAIDFNAAYDVIDTTSGEKLGVFRRKGMKSMLRDEWEILDTNDQIIGSIKEDSGVLALVRRFLTNLVPQEFHAFIGEKMVWHFKQQFNPFVSKIELDMTHDTEDIMDNRLGIAAAVLLCAIEGRQH